MDISLREWLIIGGVLIVILILVDGWRRVSANRSRLRLEIDRTLSELSADDPNNPELPNGGARMRGGQMADAAAGQERIEPGFADEDGEASTPDPLFDDIPAVKAAERRSAAAGASVETPRVPADPVSPELRVQDTPIPVLLDEVDTGSQAHVDEVAVPMTPAASVAVDAPKTRLDDGMDVPEGVPNLRPAATAEVPTDLDPPEVPSRQEPVRPRGEPAVDGPAATGLAAEGEQISPQPEPPSPPEPESEPEPAPRNTPVRSNRGLKHTPDPEHVLVITVVGRQGAYLPGPALNRVVTACGMEWGDMDIYHRPEDSRPDAPIQFSMANAVAPGTFDPDNLEALETPAVTFFMSMDEPTDTMTAYECMLATAETLAKHLNGDLLDEDRSVMRPQTKEHYRERIRDFEMHQRQRRAN